MIEKAEHNNEQEVTGKFAMIPIETLGMLNKNILTPAGTVEKIDGDDLTWWGFFFTFRYQNKPCYQTRKTISERFDCSEKTVTRRTARLEGLGLLTVKKRKGTSNIFTAASVEEFLAKKTNKKVTPKEESSGEETKRQPVTDAPEISAPVAEQSGSVSPVAAGGDASLPAGDDAVNALSQERQEVPQREDIQIYKYWREEGPSGFGFKEYGAKHGETDVDMIAALIDQHYSDAFSQITIFDENGVVTEAFINALSRGEAPNRNDDGTLQKYGFAYAMARAYQAHREGKPEDEIQHSIPVWIESALPEHIPAHLLPTDSPPSEPTLDFDEEEYEEEGFDAPC